MQAHTRPRPPFSPASSPAAARRARTTGCLTPAHQSDITASAAVLRQPARPSTISVLLQHVPAPALADASSITAARQRSGVPLRPVLVAARAREADSAASAAAEAPPAASAKQQVMELLAGGHTNLAPDPRMAAAVEALIASSNTPDPGPSTFRLGQGIWEVFYAPHIKALSALMFQRFDPVRYTLVGDQLHSNVHYEGFWSGGGWLSASGSMAAKSKDTLELHFDRFWVDRGGAPLRATITAEQASQGWDGLITRIGRATFFDNLATFPVLYVDEDLTVFRFPPLGVNIAAQRVG